MADIPITSLHKLQAGSDEESLRLFEACKKEGFLFLYLGDTQQGKVLLQNSETMFDLIEETLTLDTEVLSRYASDAPRSLIG